MPTSHLRWIQQVSSVPIMCQLLEVKLTGPSLSQPKKAKCDQASIPGITAIVCPLVISWPQPTDNAHCGPSRASSSGSEQLRSWWDGITVSFKKLFSIRKSAPQRKGRSTGGLHQLRIKGSPGPRKGKPHKEHYAAVQSHSSEHSWEVL